MLRNNPSLLAKDTGSPRGLGVFSEREYLSGQLLESCYFVCIRQKISNLPLEIKTRVYDLSNELGENHVYALALGFGSLFNHSNSANLKYDFDREKRVINYTASRDIDAGEELCINYNGNASGQISPDEDWFNIMGIAYID